MYRILLINMPFAAFNAPSLALTQLKSVVDTRFGADVSADILYLNQDFALYLDAENARMIETSPAAQNSGFGEWLFRQSAFPGLPDNEKAYLQRYFPYRNEQNEAVKNIIREKRPGVDRFMDDLIDKYKINEAGLVGFTSMFHQNAACFAMARKLKKRNPDIVTVMGGTNCEPPMGGEIVRNVKHIDFVFSGHSLKSFPEFVHHVLNGDMDKCDGVRGVISRSHCETGKCVNSESLGDELDLDHRVEINYDEFMQTFDMNFPDNNIKPKLFFETSRGCWWGERAHCTFCGLNGTAIKYRAMNPENAVAQFKSLFKYSGKCAEFQCVDNIMPRNYPQDVFSVLDTPPDASIFYEVRASMIGQDMDLIARAGVKRVQPGIESLATGTLKLMKKGTTAFQNVLFLKNCLTCGIKPDWNLLVGSPGEGEEVYEKYVRDLPLLSHLPPPTGAYPIRFDRYSTYFVEAEKFGLDLRPLDYYAMIYPFSRESLANLAYYFMDHNFSADYFSSMVKWINKIRERIDQWQNRWKVDERGLPAELYFIDHKTVYDSRSGEAAKHQIGVNGGQLLKLLAGPTDISRLASNPDITLDSDPEREIRSLQERGLLFEEGGRFMSLVLDQGPLSVFHSAEGTASIHERSVRTRMPGEPSLVPLSRKAFRAESASGTERDRDF